MNFVLNWRRTLRLFVRTKAVLTAIFYSGSLLALPVCPPPRNSLLELVNYVGEDKREPLNTGGPKLKLTEDEMARIRKVNGILSCVFPNGKPTYGSASLVGDGSQIVTAAHAFQDPETKKFYEPLSKCTFTNFDTPPQTSTLAIDSSHKGLLMGKDYPKQSQNDYAYAKLTKPFKNVKPFPVDLSDTQIRDNRDTIVVSGIQTNMPNRDPKQPIIEPCGMNDKEFIGATTLYYNDCTIFPGSSGGSQYVRSASGELVLKGIVIENGPALKGDYDKVAGSYSVTAAIGTRALSDLLKFDPSIRLGNGGVNDNQ